MVWSKSNNDQFPLTATFDPNNGYTMDRYAVFGHVFGVYIDNRFTEDSRLDTAAMRPTARCALSQVCRAGASAAAWGQQHPRKPPMSASDA